MEFYAFIASVVLISLSGVLAPGPVFAAAIAEGRTNRYAGFHITAGHAVVEIPLIMALAAFGTLAATENLRTAVSLAGGAVLLYLAYDTATTCPSKECRRRGMLTGVVLSALSPYFIIWWLTVGFTLIIDALAFGAVGLVAFVIVHEGCDAAWLGFVSLATHRSSRSFGPGAERALTASSVAILAVFGILFIAMGVSALL
jgi:threonine/homoserine/homoserine lactone efflux protein